MIRASARPVVLFACALAIAILAASCNSILGNREGHLRVDAGSFACEPGREKLCSGACVKALDPPFGCKADTCEPCNLPRTATYQCKGTGCGVSTCFTAYDNCDQQDPNGCEVDLRRPESCGTCNTSCDPGLDKDRYCNSYDPKDIRCVRVCPPESTVCEGTRQCINPKIDIANCGGCAGQGGKVCEAPAGAIPTCNDGQCGIACNAALGFRGCPDGTCRQENADACGPSCEKCTPSGPNLEAYCEQGRCKERCAQGLVLCAGTCQPPPCQTTCNAPMGTCPGDPGPCQTDLSRLPHCGTCMEDCRPPPPNQSPICIPGGPNGFQCDYRCDAPFTMCSPPNGGCVMTSSDPNHCGRCNHACHSACMNGQCDTSQCDPGWRDCDGQEDNGCELFGAECPGGMDGGLDGGMDGGLDGRMDAPSFLDGGCDASSDAMSDAGVMPGFSTPMNLPCPG